jgi:hypothetical protein
MILPILFFALVLVNQSVNMIASDALLDSCNGHVELSGNSKLSNFNGTVVARNATLEIVDSRIDNLYCYNSKIEAYHNLIRYVQLENCTMIASLNTFAVVIGNNSSLCQCQSHVHSPEQDYDRLRRQPLALRKLCERSHR